MRYGARVDEPRRTSLRPDGEVRGYGFKSRTRGLSLVAYRRLPQGHPRRLLRATLAVMNDTTREVILTTPECSRCSPGRERWRPRFAPTGWRASARLGRGQGTGERIDELVRRGGGGPFRAGICRRRRPARLKRARGLVKSGSFDAIGPTRELRLARAAIELREGGALRQQEPLLRRERDGEAFESCARGTGSREASRGEAESLLPERPPFASGMTRSRMQGRRSRTAPERPKMAAA